MSPEASELARAANALTALLEGRQIHLDEKRGEYYYEDVTLKKWVLGDGGVSGNCEECNEAADLGYIDMDDVFDMFDEDADEPPGHPNCTCSIEYKDTRQRVYV